MINTTSATKKKTAPINKSPNLIVADNEAINGTKEAKFKDSLNMINKLMFSIKSKIPAKMGVKLI